MFQLVVRLSEQQKGVLEDLFSSTMSIREVLEKRQIDRSEYCQWLEQELFVSKFNRMLELLRLESKLVLARYSSQIAAKMISLAMEEDSEISRQACSDVIKHPDFKEDIGEKRKEKDAPYLTEDGKLRELPPELASKLLDTLANMKNSL